MPLILTKFVLVFNGVLMMPFFFMCNQKISSMSQKFCQNCGGALPEGAGACPHCGTPVAAPRPAGFAPNSYQPPRNGSNVMGVLLPVLLSLVVAVLAGGGIYFYKSRAAEKEAAEKARVEALQQKQDELVQKNAALAKQCEQLADEATKQAAAAKKAAARAVQATPVVKPAAGYYAGHIKREGGYTNARREPSSSGYIVNKIKDGTPVFFVPATANWYEVYTLDYDYYGYVHKSKIVAGF